MGIAILNTFKKYIENNAPKELNLAVAVDKDIVVLTANAESVVSLMYWLKDDVGCMFKQLTDVCGVDYPANESRFEVVYHMLSFKHNRRIRVKVLVDDGESVPSISEVFHAADWLEREVWDMYGVFFTDHPDLRRILSDYGFEGHALRKDFPVTGYKEVRYDDEKKRVVYEPVVLDQEFRNFDFLSPWEGTDYVLPGDEKAVDKK